VLKQANIDLFKKVCHKTKPTLTMLEDEEFLRMINDLQVCFSDAKKIEAVDRMCQGIIESLKKG
jgi:hypothetical protein